LQPEDAEETHPTESSLVLVAHGLVAIVFPRSPLAAEERERKPCPQRVTRMTAMIARGV
jgi:hypothetical protein